MKTFFSIMIALVLLVSCSEKALDACDCAKELNAESTKAANFQRCTEARKDPAFEKEFVKCTAAIVMNRDTNEIHLDEEKPVMQAPKDGSYTIEAGQDQVNWRGQKANGEFHSGKVPVKSGSVTVRKRQISSGTIVIDMASLSNTDITDAKSKTKLENHLRSEDFFDVAKYPEATFVIKSSANNGSRGVLQGDLTIKGKTLPVTVNAVVSGAGDSTIVCTGGFQFDRSKYDVRYGSDSFFDNLGDDMIEDLIAITFNVYAKRD